MKSWQWILILLLVIVVLLIGGIFFVPLPRELGEYSDPVLVEFRQYHNFFSSYDSFKIYNDGSVSVYIGGEKPKLQLSEEQLKYVTDFVENKKYSSKNRSLFSKWRDNKSNGLESASFVVNENGKVVLIDFDKGLYDIVQSLKRGADII